MEVYLLLHQEFLHSLQDYHLLNYLLLHLWIFFLPLLSVTLPQLLILIKRHKLLYLEKVKTLIHFNRLKALRFLINLYQFNNSWLWDLSMERIIKPICLLLPKLSLIQIQVWKFSMSILVFRLSKLQMKKKCLPVHKMHKK